jgi:hypothetical protein
MAGRSFEECEVKVEQASATASKQTSDANASDSQREGKRTEPVAPRLPKGGHPLPGVTTRESLLEGAHVDTKEHCLGRKVRYLRQVIHY